MDIISFENFKWHFFEKGEHDLDGVNLKIRKGEFVGITGPTGSGKTALCYAIMGVIPHLSNGKVISGRVLVDGLDITKHSVGELASHVGIILQSPKSQLTGAGLSIEEEIAFGLENNGVPRKEMKRRIKEVLMKTGLYKLRKRSPFEVSGGQQQKVAIASVLVLQPEILILDEPTGYLDPEGTEAVFNLVKDLNKEGKTIILVTHKLEYLSEFADRVILFNNGKVIKDGRPDEVLGDYNLLVKNKLTPLPVTTLGKELKWRNYPITVRDAVRELRRELK